MRGLSLVAASGGYSSLWCTGFSLQWLLLLRSLGSKRAGFSSCGTRALECRLSSCGTWAQLLRGMWDLPGPGLEPVSPALAGGFLTTAPPGKSFFLIGVDLQCCVRFWCIAKWFSYTYMYIFFFIFFSIMVYYRILNIVPCAIQWDLIVYLFYI